MECERSIESLLNISVFRDGSLLDAIRNHLTDGRMVVVRDAFNGDFAEATYKDLHSYMDWTAFQEFGRTSFCYNRLRETNLPPTVSELRTTLSTGATKRFAEKLTGRDCGGRAIVNAALYRPGDYLAPHTDSVGNRSVALVWHLSRGWDPEWGGQFVWCKTGASVSPMFNSLILFNVSSATLHLVLPVTPRARGKRLSVYGWWRSGTPDTHPRATTVSVNDPVNDPHIWGGHYGPSRVQVDDRGDVVAI